MANDIVASTDQQKVTKELCLDYIKAQNTNLTEGEFKQYAAVATALNLNPFLREIYPIKYGKDGKMTLVTGYQVYIRRAEEFPQYDGFDTSFEGEGKNLCCVCNVYRKDRNRPTSARCYLAEYTQNNTMWNGKPHVMLEKCAIGTAFRRAFPSEFNGMPYTAEEIRAEDELKQQGYTEVKAEEAPAPAPDTKLQNFLKAMAKLKSIDENTYTMLLNAMGYKSEEEVAAEDRRHVHTSIKTELEKTINTEEKEG